MWERIWNVIKKEPAFVTVQQGVQTRTHNRLSVEPYVGLWFNEDPDADPDARPDVVYGDLAPLSRF